MPVLNEAAGIAAAVQALAPLLARGAELVIVDGGSTDATLAYAQVLARAPQCKVIASSRGRARQMNAGAAQASGDVLLFLHADTTLPPAADVMVTQALGDGRTAWGRFDVRIAARSPLLRLVARAMNLRSRWSGIATGDQALFVRRSVFEATGGFAEQPLMEDIDLSRRLLAISRPACLRAQVQTSGRRWESRGTLRTIVLMWRLRFAYWRGVPANKLVELYQ
jgi:rSAM/selenodomain-associated transferase 2